MNIRGITKFTLVDYPGKIACIVFVGNCNFICPYCHNPFLVVDPGSQPLITEKEFYLFLESRVGKLDAVVISGGEPTLRKELFEFAREIKQRGFLIKLDTNGSMPEIVKKLYKNRCLDFIGVDYKASKAKYQFVSGCKDEKLSPKVSETIAFVIKSEIPYDVRTTVHKALLTELDIMQMRKELNDLGVKDWALQQFHPTEIMDESLLNIETYTDSELLTIAKKLPNTKVRGLKGMLLR